MMVFLTKKLFKGMSKLTVVVSEVRQLDCSLFNVILVSWRQSLDVLKRLQGLDQVIPVKLTCLEILNLADSLL